MANVNLLNQLAGSVAPQGRPFNAAQSVAAGQKLVAGNERLALLRAKLDAQRTQEARQAEIDRILQMGGSPGEIGQNIMALDPRMGLDYMKFQQTQDQMADDDAARRAQELALQNYAASEGLDPNHTGILMADPANAFKTIQGNILASGDTGVEYGLSPVRAVGPNGELGLFQLGKGGQIKSVDLPEGFSPAGGTSRVDLGTEWGIIDNTTGNIVSVLPKDIAGAESEKVRGKTEGERAANLPKAKAAYQELTMQRGLLREKLNEALGNSGFWTSGWSGRIAEAVPGTPAYDMARTLDTIKAVVGFDKLQQMRDSSPTGGALGQITERELAFLQAVFGSFDQFQSADQLRSNMTRLLDMLDGFDAIRSQAFADTFGETPPAGNLLVPEKKSGSVDDMSDDEIMRELEQMRQQQR